MPNILKPLGLTPEHNIAVADMQKNPAKYGIGSQFDYATESAKDMVNRASNPATATMSAIGNVVARPVYDFYDATKEYGKKGYQGEFSFSPQGAVDFAKNLGAFGKEFLGQKPVTMMGGALKGGIESLGTQLGEGIYGLMNKFRQDQFMNTQKQTIQEVIRQAEIEQKRKEEAEAAASAASAAAQVRANIQRYGSGDRPNTGINTPGTGKGQSPTGGDVQGTPFAQGGLINLYRYGGFI